MPFQPAINAADVPAGEARPAFVEDRWIAVCNDAGRFFACDNDCPHAGGSLSRGEVSDGRIVCPVHHWPFDLTTGKTVEEWDHMRVRCYATDLRAGVVHVDLAASPAANSECGVRSSEFGMKPDARRAF